MRNWIYQALCAIILDQVYSNLYLRDHLDSCPKKDRALATRIVYGTIQNYGYLNYAIDQYAQKKVDKRVRILLAMSLYQLFYLDKVPAYAIVDEANQICRKISPKSRGFVNAMLHRIKKDQIHLPDDPLESLSIQTSLPLWLIRMWNAQYGEKRTRQMAWASLKILPVYVRRNPIKASSQEFEEAGWEKVNGDLYRYPKNDVAHHPFYREGKMSVQDLGSYQIACFVDAKAGMHVLDACAAPGTKSMAILERMKDQGSMTCIDIHPHRVKLIQNEIRRLGVHHAKAFVCDASEIDDLGVYDRILCDVPCSGYGVLARKPDIRLRLKSTDMDTLIPLQKKILESCAAHVKEKGQIVYSTCTINKKENEKQIEAFLQAHPNFSLMEEKILFPNDQADGFYMAKLEKES